jgi:hypothetical protein
MKNYLCINGRVFDFEPTADEQKFIDCVAAAVDDPKVKESDLVALIYGPENPLLESKAGYSFVTPAAFANPVYRVLTDLLDRKRVKLGLLNLEKAASRYTLSVAQAAEKLGIAPSAVRTAVLDGRLPSWMKDGQIFLDPHSVESYEVVRRGRSPQLRVTCGSHDGASMRVRVVGGELEVTNKAKGLVDGLVKQWEEMSIITSAKRDGDTSYRYWWLKPGGVERRVELGPFKVVGRFTIEEQRNGKAASEAWHSTERKSGRQYIFE